MAKVLPRATAAKASSDTVKVTAAKGRPLLTWVGKRPLRSVTAFPAQEVERYSGAGPVAEIDWSDWPDRYPRGGLLFHVDNKEVLAHLLANGFRGKVNLIYIDPPFDSGADYVRRVELRGVTGTAKLDGAGYTLGEQLQATEGPRDQPELIPASAMAPAQRSFATYRVNDYDLHVERQALIGLVIEHVGVSRTPTDSFFEGTLGKRLVKIVPFDHPIGPLDLDDVAKELRARPKEERDVVVVGVGKELACDPWLADHNRRGAPNQIAIIELRSDPKYGKFFTHQRPKAMLSVRRSGSKATVEIKDFVSPTIIERLNAQEGIVAPKITDWRSMVDSVMIDTDYDGTVFDIAVADVPERKDDLVTGTYEVEVGSAKRKATIAVKITDMLGEELLVTSEV